MGGFDSLWGEKVSTNQSRVLSSQIVAYLVLSSRISLGSHLPSKGRAFMGTDSIIELSRQL